jgi:FAD/FMN-containing dehydrogenase
MNSSESFIACARQELGPDRVITDRDDCSAYERDYFGRSGQALAVLCPKSTAETSAALRLCARYAVTVVPQSGRTGLVGASTPDDSGRQVILSLCGIDQVGHLDAANRSIHVGAGVRMSRLRQVLAPAGLWFPFDIAADPCVGGMLATNTGGSHLMRFGDVRSSVLGVEAVLADGTVVDSLKALRKDNAGFDCKQLFIGSGGGLGVITGAVLALQRRPVARVSALLLPHSHERIPELLSWLEARYGDLIISFEGLSGNAIRYAYRAFPDLPQHFEASGIPDYVVLVELASAGLFQAQSLAADVHDSVAQLVSRAAIRGALVGDEADYWALRDAVPRALMKLPRVISLDVAFARSRLTQFRVAVQQLLSTQYPGAVLADFGHFGDGGDHVTIVVPDDCPTGATRLALMRLRVAVYDLVAEYGGSFSAEHGVGPLNESAYRRYTPPTTRRVHSSIKRLLDPAQRLGRLGMT